MFLYLLPIFVTVAFGQECKEFENVLTSGLNQGCNWAGTCIGGYCYCCTLDPITLEPEKFDGIPDCPGWMGGLFETGAHGACKTQTEFASVTWKYYFPENQNYNCQNADSNAALLQSIIDFYNLHDYPGIIVQTNCKKCRPSDECRFYDPDNSNIWVDHTDGTEFEVGTDIHTYYDTACFNSADPVPSIYLQSRCPEDYDQGYLGYYAFKRVRDYNPSAPNAWDAPGTADILAINADIPENATESTFNVILNTKDVSVRTLNPTAYPSPIPTTAPPTEAPTEAPTQAPTEAPTRAPTGAPTEAPTQTPTMAPTFAPTTNPTLTPTNADDCFTKGYTNKPSDIKYMGNGDNCRAGLKLEWPGGRSCASPYIVCLPQENTPNQAPKDPFFSDTHQYTVDQCVYECAYDQRCRGFEFVAASGTNVGECNLIDDLPLEITNQGSYVYSDSDADLSTAGALCFQKEDYCNPFFEADDLAETMLECYCSNNRKGFYTKKVKRTVANSKFCGGDPDVTERIKQAQANRMFHLCENWCIFNTFQPEQESWYWNPWKKCWREQYAGVGTHRSYCNRVIRNPDTIEQYFINYRTANFCAPMTQVPTKNPTELGTQWYLAQEEESCIDACESRSAVCSEAMTASLGETTSDTDLGDAFQEAGQSCTSYGVAPIHYAAPVYNALTGACLRRNDGTEANTGCQWAVGVGYQRLCACTV